jgi:hypothetical protein
MDLGLDHEFFAPCEVFECASNEYLRQNRLDSHRYIPKNITTAGAVGLTGRKRLPENSTWRAPSHIPCGSKRSGVVTTEHDAAAEDPVPVSQ